MKTVAMVIGLMLAGCLLPVEDAERDDIGAAESALRVRDWVIARNEPAKLFKSGLVFWFRAEDYEPATDTTAGRWPDVTGQKSLGTFTVANSPVAANGINGAPTVLSDGVDDILGLQEPGVFAVGTRPYVAMLVRAETLSIPGPFFAELLAMYAALPTATNGTTYAFLLRAQAHPAFDGQTLFAATFNLSADDFCSFKGAPWNTEPHIIEMSVGEGGVGHFVVDGEPYDEVWGSGDPNIGPIPAAVTGMTIMAKPESSSPTHTLRPVNMHFRDLVALDRMPTKAERARLLRYLRLRAGL